ncbi:unnamed protein product, partial [Mesorhabditis spiculigera]
MRYVVAGGGVAGVSCVRALRQYLDEEHEVILITAGPHVKSVHNWFRVGQFTELFDVKEVGLSFVGEPISVVEGAVIAWSYENKDLELGDGSHVPFDYLVIATGARPKNPYPEVGRILTIRDTETARQLEQRLAGAKRVAVVGNGGIATEIIFELRDVDITWCIRDAHISAAYFDAETAAFLYGRAEKGREAGDKNDEPVRRPKFCDSEAGSSTSSSAPGCALGPDWSTVVQLKGAAAGHNIRVVPSVEVEAVEEKADSLVLRLSNGEAIEVDMAIWATGVTPNSELWRHPGLKLAEDGGILVDETMATSLPGIWACGDVCTAGWVPSRHWSQIRTWTQARQMGDCAGQSCSGATDLGGFCFELFAHCTTFYGYKIVLLGDFQAKNQPPGWYINERIITDGQLVRCVMHDHRMQGAVLIGETELEEVFENLILNQTDMEDIEDDFLEPAIDLEDYFD